MAKKETKKDVYYFSHDYNPTSDPKMLAFVGEYGAVGYGIYWRIVEMLHESQEHTLPLKNYIYSALAKQMLTDVEQVFKIVESCINEFELFDCNDEVFWCNRVLRNVEKRLDLIAKKKKAGDASAKARQERKEAEEMATHDQHNSTHDQHNSTHDQHNSTDDQHNSTEGNKGKEIKLNETKENNINKDNSGKNKNKLFTFSEIISELKLEGTQKNLILAQYKTDSNTLNKYIDFFSVQYTPETETETFSLNEKRIHFKNFLKNNWGKLPQQQEQRPKAKLL